MTTKEDLIAKIKDQSFWAGDYGELVIDLDKSIDIINEALTGYSIVPDEPTNKMTESGYMAMPACACTDGEQWRARLIYKAMLSATKGKDNE